MADVFISYARQDETIARRVAQGLQAAGLDVWWDADLPAHRSYSEIIERNLEEAKAVVVLWSKNAAASQWVRAESDFARDAGKLVQAQVDGKLPPMPFNQIQCADLRRWHGGESHSGWTKLKDSIDALVSGEERPHSASRRPRLWDRVALSWPFVALIPLLVAAGIYLRAFGVPWERHKPVLAVLPFKSLNPRDDVLVAGIWEDTRTAVGRNPQLTVLGPNSAQNLADNGEVAARKAADYLLEASVRTDGDRIRVSTELIRSEDGEQLWSQNFDRKLGDVFALQLEIASEIEGHIRGRLAKKGGKVPEHIATSGEVYALYSDARVRLRSRGLTEEALALHELEQIVKLDPNFAPAWASLARVLKQLPPQRLTNSDVSPGNSEAYARKAIELAPNLGAAHLALATVLDLKGPVATAEVERAVELDPNDYEAFNALGSVYEQAGDRKSALEAFTRASEIDPFYWPPALNKLQIFQEMGDQAGARRFLEHENRIGANFVAEFVTMDQAMRRGDIARSANIGLKYWNSQRPEARTLIIYGLSDALEQLGYDDLAIKVLQPPDFVSFLDRKDPKGLDMLEARHINVRAFFQSDPLTEHAGRIYLLSGRSKRLADLYLSMNLSPQEFFRLSNSQNPDHFLNLGPIVAIALKQSGHVKEAESLIVLAEKAASDQLRTGPSGAAQLARVYALEGRKDDALRFLSSAVSRNWLPPPPMLPIDLDDDPAFVSLKNDPRFRMLRQKILDTIAQQRLRVDQRLLAQLRAS